MSFSGYGASPAANNFHPGKLQILMFQQTVQLHAGICDGFKACTKRTIWLQTWRASGGSKKLKFTGTFPESKALQNQHANLRLSVRKVKNTPTAELHQTLQNSLKTRPKTLLIFLKYIEQGRNEMAQVIVEPTTQNYDKGSETSNKELIVETGDG